MNIKYYGNDLLAFGLSTYAQQLRYCRNPKRSSDPTNCICNHLPAELNNATNKNSRRVFGGVGGRTVRRLEEGRGAKGRRNISLSSLSACSDTADEH